MLNVLYRDEWVVAVNKPSGVHVHATRLSPGEVSLLPRVRDYMGHWVWPVHRLDRGTSGVVLFACSREAAGEFTRLFREQTVDKRYLGVVRGVPEATGRIDHPVRHDNGVVSRPAITDFRCLAAAEVAGPVGRYATGRYALVDIRPRSGRRHQIRRHFHHISHPLIGDTTYGDGRHNRFFRERFGIQRLLLVALELDFVHPVTRQRIHLAAPPADEFREVCVCLGWSGILTDAQISPGSSASEEMV